MDASMLATIAAALASNPEASRAFGAELARGFFAAPAVAQSVAAQPAASADRLPGGSRDPEGSDRAPSPARKPRPSRAKSASPRQPSPTQPAEPAEPARSMDRAQPAQPAEPARPAQSSPIEQKTQQKIRVANIASPVAQRVAITEDDIEAALDEFDYSNY